MGNQLLSCFDLRLGPQETTCVYYYEHCQNPWLGKGKAVVPSGERIDVFVSLNAHVGCLFAFFKETGSWEEDVQSLTEN